MSTSTARSFCFRHGGIPEIGGGSPRQVDMCIGLRKLKNILNYVELTEMISSLTKLF